MNKIKTAFPKPASNWRERTLENRVKKIAKDIHEKGIDLVFTDWKKYNHTGEFKIYHLHKEAHKSVSVTIFIAYFDHLGFQFYDNKNGKDKIEDLTEYIDQIITNCK